MNTNTRKKRVRHPQVDWDKVPVVIEGTPNPQALRLMWDAVRQADLDRMCAKQKAEQAGGARVVSGIGPE